MLCPSLTCASNPFLIFRYVFQLHHPFVFSSTRSACTMMSAFQPQCSNLQSLADALAVDFAGACVRPQTQRLFKLVFPDAPAVRCGGPPTDYRTAHEHSGQRTIDNKQLCCSLALLARNQLVGSLDLSAGGGAFTAIRSSQATAAEACIRTNAACCSVSR